MIHTMEERREGHGELLSCGLTFQITLRYPLLYCSAHAV